MPELETVNFKNMRILKPAVTIFLHHQEKYLFIERFEDRSVDAGRLNGIGGKVEPNEDFLTTAIRETKEETGIRVEEKSIKFCGLLRTTGGYPVDWLVGFFLVEVDSFSLPIGDKCREGVFRWMSPQEFKKNKTEVVDDLNYLFPNYLTKRETFFAQADINSEEKIVKFNIRTLA